MKEIGHAIVGDRRYGGKSSQAAGETNNGTRSRLCLWSVEITLPHPKTGVQKTFTLSKDPEWLDHVIQLEEEAWKERQSGFDGTLLREHGQVGPRESDRRDRDDGPVFVGRCS